MQYSRLQIDERFLERSVLIDLTLQQYGRDCWATFVSNSNYLFLAVRPSLLDYRLLFVFCCQAPTSDLFPLVCFGILLYRQCSPLCLQKNCICTPLCVCARAVYQILSIQLPPCALILSFVGLTVNFPLENAFCEVQIDEMYCLASV